jgi:ubiquinone biosynthesis protein UbiJ
VFFCFAIQRCQTGVTSEFTEEQTNEIEGIAADACYDSINQSERIEDLESRIAELEESMSR